MGQGVATGVGAYKDLFSSDSSDPAHRTTTQQSTTTSQNNLANESDVTTGAKGAAQNQYGSLGGELNNFSQNSQGNSEDIDALFKQALTKFAAGSGQPSADQMNQATQYVDQTFSAPAQTSYNRFLTQAQGAIADRSAALGRSSSDVGYQREFAAQAGNAAEDLANQRGSLIAQRADYLTNQLPQNQLSALMQGSQYFNTSANQAFQNRLGLLNASTGQQSVGLQGQIAGGKTTNNMNASMTLPDATDATKWYNAGSAWGASNTQSINTVGSIYSMGAGGGAKAGGGGGGGGSPASSFGNIG